MTLRTAIYQIHYDSTTREQVEPGFIGLDNRAAPDPGWYEFWPIYQYLETHELEDEVWYGFVSPRFAAKTRWRSPQVHDFLNRLPPQTEVALFSPGWDQLCYFQNPWQQGEVWHPGLSEAMQAFLSHMGDATPIDQLVTDVGCSVFSNYVIAKKRYWMAWLTLASQLYAFMAEHPQWQNARTPYGSLAHIQPLKAFLQERLASYLLATQAFQVVATAPAHDVPIFQRLFPGGEADRRLFALCDHFKRRYRQTAEAAYLNAYWDTRQHIAFTPPYQPTACAA